MIIPDTSKHIYEFILQSLKSHQKRPIIVGLSGPQGSGKSTVVASLAAKLKADSLNVVEFSLDDVYLKHPEQLELRETTKNPLVYKRGLPGTHDTSLCMDIFEALQHQQGAAIPIYDKSAFNGEGDRSSETISVKPPYDVVLFEGWMVGFDALSEHQIEQAYQMSRKNAGHLTKYNIDDVKFINSRLKLYQDHIWSQFDVFVHLSAINISYIYKWRLEQEHALVAKKGKGMSDDQVKQFVDGYMPAYELYSLQLNNRPGLHLKLDEDRRVVEVVQKQ